MSSKDEALRTSKSVILAALQTAGFENHALRPWHKDAADAIKVIDAVLKLPDNTVAVNFDHLAQLFMLVDPPPTTTSGGKTLTFQNPNAAEVLTKISAIVREMGVKK